MKSNAAELIQVKMVAHGLDAHQALTATASSAIDDSRANAIDLAVHQSKLDGRWERMREERALALQISRQTPW